MLLSTEKEFIKKMKEEYKDNKDVLKLIGIAEYEGDDKGEPDVFFAKQFERYLNGNCRSMDKALDYIRYNMHRALQSDANKFVLRYIKVIGDESNRYDGRNESTIKDIMRVKELCQEDDLYLW